MDVGGEKEVFDDDCELLLGTLVFTGLNVWTGGFSANPAVVDDSGSGDGSVEACCNEVGDLGQSERRADTVVDLIVSVLM